MLQDLKQAAYYIERGAKNNNADDLETGHEYWGSCNKHLNRLKPLLPGGRWGF